MKRFALAALTAAVLGSGPDVRANDSAAAIGAGGIELVQQGDVAMLSEDLYVSVPKIRVRYEFRNEGAAPVKTLVAFPLPELNLEEMLESEIGWPSNDQNDPTGFKVRVDGIPVTPKLERKAVYKGRDVTADLKAAGVPLVYPFGDFWDRVKRVKKADIDRLIKLGVVEFFEETREIRPKWTLKNTYYWEQVFPPGKIVNVEHEYAPVTGGSFWGDGMPKTEAEARANEYLRDFCLDQQTLNGIEAKLAALKAGAPESLGMLSYVDVRYILKTGRNWKGPIGRFKLSVDKGSPSNLVSFCATGVSKASPTVFTVEKTAWEPDADLAVMILQPMK